jgi:ADP-heptose:LPS heptosyltransferase
VYIEIVRPLKVGGQDPEYQPGDCLNCDIDSAVLLVGLGLAKPTDKYAVKPEAKPGNGNGNGNGKKQAAPELKDVKQLRRDVGVRPYDPNVYFHDRATLYNCKPGDKLLIIRKYGGLGDVLICSYLLPIIHERYPQNPLTFANPRIYRDLFQGVEWLNFLEYDSCFQDYTFIRGGVIANEVTEKYDVVEDISTPCHIWETLFKNWNFDAGGLKWRNRLDMWGNWIGINGIENPVSCVKIRPEEVNEARVKHFGATRNVLALCPMSAADPKDFTYYWELRQALERQGWNVRYVGHKPWFDALAHEQPIQTDSNRELLALLGAADCVVTVDSACLHGAAIMGVPTVGIFNINDGKTYCKYYPTVTPVQTCQTPCIMSKTHGCQWEHLGRHTCYPPESVDKIAEAVKGIAKPKVSKPVRRKR